MSKVWLITGSGNGLGRNIAEAALAAGDSVVAGARRTEELAPLVAPKAEAQKVYETYPREPARQAETLFTRLTSTLMARARNSWVSSCRAIARALY